jgi:serine/threonine protein phosphatase PrpC
MVDDPEVLRLVQEHGIDAVEPLVDLANERGGDDNITVAVVKLSPADPGGDGSEEEAEEVHSDEG